MSRTDASPPPQYAAAVPIPSAPAWILSDLVFVPRVAERFAVKFFGALGLPFRPRSHAKRLRTEGTKHDREIHETGA